eukprot:5975215-Pleurochrysis_carterae.AAC.3
MPPPPSTRGGTMPAASSARPYCCRFRPFTYGCDALMAPTTQSKMSSSQTFVDPARASREGSMMRVITSMSKYARKNTKRGEQKDENARR